MTRLFVSAILLYSVQFGFSQNNKDAELWVGGSVSSKIVKNLNADIALQSRFFNNATQFKTVFLQIGLDYNLISNFDVGLTYRVARRNELDHFTTMNRLSINASFQEKFKDLGLKFKIRGRYQYSFNRLNTINDVIIPEDKSAWRLKATLTYGNDLFKKIDPFINGELFYSTDPSITNNLFAFRLGMGTSYSINKRSNLKFRYIYEHSRSKTPQFSHIYNLTYNYKLKGKLLKRIGLVD